MAASAQASFPAAFWRALKRIDKSKLNSPWMALRNSLAVALPLAIEIELGNPLSGIAIATGALNVAYSDGRDPYAQRARRMLAWSVLGAVAVFLGSASGRAAPLAILVVAAWAFAAGMLVSISTRAGDLGLNTLVALIVYSTRAAMSPKGALYAGLLVLGGGLLQTILALLFWPVRRTEPEERAVAQVYRDLAKQVDPRFPNILAAPLAQPSPEVQDVLSALGRDHTLEGERFRLLLDQADRLRLSIYAVERLQHQFAQASVAGDKHSTARAELARNMDELLSLAAEILGHVSDSLAGGKTLDDQHRLLQKLHEAVELAQKLKAECSDMLAADLAAAADTLGGQLRVVVELAGRSLDPSLPEFPGQTLAPSWKLQLKGWLATMRANLYPGSSAFRHAVRLSVCVAASDAIGRSIGVQRNYWLPMTVAVVLKPDFTSTISRGVLRLCGTFAGLLLATALFHIFPPSGLSELLLVGLFMFFLRYLGGAHYGIFSVAISGLIVFLIAETGVKPSDVVAQRAINTLAGGLFALVAYSLWPTWEKTHVAETIAEMMDGARIYFRAVVERFTFDSPEVKETLDDTRSEWRRRRTAAEASVDRLSSEPGVHPAQVNILTSILASSSGLVHAFTGLEAGVVGGAPTSVPPALGKFANDVEFTLYFISAALRGSAAATETLPKLREDYRQLVAARNAQAVIDEYVLLETDRLTVSLNTLREQVSSYVSAYGS